MITSTGNSTVVAAAKLHSGRERRKRRRTLLEGPHLIQAAATAGITPELVFALPSDRRTAELAARTGLSVLEVSKPVLAKLAPTDHPQGPIAVFAIPEAGAPSRTDTVVLMGISDPGNAGTLIRSAAAFGFAVAISGDNVDVWAPKVLRAGAGAHFSVGISRLDGDPLRVLRRAGLRPVAAVPRDGSPPGGTGTEPLALMIGSEPRGLSDAVVAGADERVTLATTADVESLNAAVAGSILMYELSQRGNRVRSQ